MKTDFTQSGEHSPRNMFLKKHMSTRIKELVLGLLLWSIWLIITSGIDPTIFFVGLISVLSCLAIITSISLFSPLNQHARQKESPLIKLVLKPNDKKKWLIFFIVLALLVPSIIFNYLLPKPEVFRYFVTALFAFSGVFILELLELWKKRWYN